MGGHPDKALPYLQKASQLDPRNLDYQLSLARAGMEAGQLPVADAALSQATNLAPTNIAVLKMRISLLCFKQDFSSARPLLLHLNEIEPGEENVHWLTNVEARIQQQHPHH
jgi:tetratricopeptide (TPR) repeat protein